MSQLLKIHLGTCCLKYLAAFVSMDIRNLMFDYYSFSSYATIQTELVKVSWIFCNFLCKRCVLFHPFRTKTKLEQGSIALADIKRVIEVSVRQQTLNYVCHRLIIFFTHFFFFSDCQIENTVNVTCKCSCLVSSGQPISLFTPNPAIFSSSWSPLHVLPSSMSLFVFSVSIYLHCVY